MEDQTIIILGSLVLLGVVFTQIFLSKTKNNKQKRVVKDVQSINIDTITQSYEHTIEILKQQIELITDESKSVKRRLAKEIGLNYAKEDDYEKPNKPKFSGDLEDNYDIDVSNGVKLVESLNIPLLKNMDKAKIPELMNNPMIKGRVWKYIKENQDEMISLGVIIPKGQVQQTAPQKTIDEKEDNPSGMLDLKFDQNNSRYMA